MLELCGDRGKIVMHGSSLRLFELKPSIRTHSRESTEMWSSPQVEEVSLEVPATGGVHTDITRNFCRAILYDEPLIAPGEAGLNAVELINAIILSSQTGKTANIPEERGAYDRLIADLQHKSRSKSAVREQRVTDP